MPPGPVLAALLASIDLDRVSGFDRVLVLRASQRQASHAQAQVLAAMAAIADTMNDDLFPDDEELAWEAAATEVRAALRLTRRAAETDLDLALGLCRRLPRVWEAMASGALDARRAWVIARHTSHLDEDTARMVADRVLDEASGLTTGQLAARLGRLCIQACPDEADQRYTAAVEDRRVVVESSPQGTANLLGLDLPPHRATAAARHIDRIAKHLNRRDDPRNLDQIRADVFLDLLLGRHHRASGGGGVEIRVDLDTLAELSEAPGDLAGYGPVIADIARQVTNAQTDAPWRFTITDPHTGLPVHDGTTRRRPTTAQRRSVTARDQTCIFPGCRHPGTQCDLDHRTPWVHHRQTSTAGLDSLCRHDHHTNRHLLGWTHRPLAGGDHLWASPLGHRYTTSGQPPPKPP